MKKTIMAAILLALMSCNMDNNQFVELEDGRVIYVDCPDISIHIADKVIICEQTRSDNRRLKSFYFYGFWKGSLPAVDTTYYGGEDSVIFIQNYKKGSIIRKRS